MYDLMKIEPSVIDTFTSRFALIHYDRLFSTNAPYPPSYRDAFHFYYESENAFECEISYYPIGLLVFLLFRRDGYLTIEYPESLLQQLVDISLSESATIPLNHILPMAYWEFVAPTTHTIDSPLVTLESFIYDHLFDIPHVAIRTRFFEAVELLKQAWNTHRLSLMLVDTLTIEQEQLEDEGLTMPYGRLLDDLSVEMESNLHEFHLDWLHPPRGGGFQCCRN